jgi:hypothetical protein
MGRDKAIFKGEYIGFRVISRFHNAMTLADWAIAERSDCQSGTKDMGTAERGTTPLPSLDAYSPVKFAAPSGEFKISLQPALSASQGWCAKGSWREVDRNPQILRQ